MEIEMGAPVAVPGAGFFLRGMARIHAGTV